MDRRALCVLCGARPVDPQWRPFCSRRCQVTDQARWATGAYRIETPVEHMPEDETDDQDDG